jgi:hypothetical protein
VSPWQFWPLELGETCATTIDLQHHLESPRPGRYKVEAALDAGFFLGKELPEPGEDPRQATVLGTLQSRVVPSTRDQLSADLDRLAVQTSCGDDWKESEAVASLLILKAGDPPIVRWALRRLADWRFKLSEDDLRDLLPMIARSRTRFIWKINQ